MTLSVGGAVAFEDGRGPRREAHDLAEGPPLIVTHRPRAPAGPAVPGWPARLDGQLQAGPPSAVLRSRSAPAAWPPSPPRPAGARSSAHWRCHRRGHRLRRPRHRGDRQGGLCPVRAAHGGAGFLVDAALLGFAVGAGFALVENVVYLRRFATRRCGCGWCAAWARPCCMAAPPPSFAMLARHADRSLPATRLRCRARRACASPIVVHATFNQLPLPPLAQTALLSWSCCRCSCSSSSSAASDVTREWVGAGLDLDVELLQLVASEHSGAPASRATCASCASGSPGRSSPTCSACCGSHLELSVQAKAMLSPARPGCDLPPTRTSGGARRARLPRAVDRPDRPAGAQAAAGDQHRDDWHGHLLAPGASRLTGAPVAPPNAR